MIMQGLFAFVILLSLCAGAGAQTLYKCRVDGTITYSGSPCEGAPSTTLEVPEAPAPDPDAAQELKRQQAVSSKLEKERRTREAAEQRTDAARARLAAAKRERCGKLALKSKYADEAAGAAAGFDKQELIEKARRMRESMAVECGA
jgi:hypothetical protein